MLQNCSAGSRAETLRRKNLLFFSLFVSERTGSQPQQQQLTLTAGAVCVCHQSHNAGTALILSVVLGCQQSCTGLGIWSVSDCFNLFSTRWFPFMVAQSKHVSHSANVALTEI